MATYRSTYDGPLPLESGDTLAKGETVDLSTLAGADAGHVESGRLVLVTGPTPPEPYSYLSLRLRRPDGALVETGNLDSVVLPAGLGDGAGFLLAWATEPEPFFTAVTATDTATGRPTEATGVFPDGGTITYTATCDADGVSTYELVHELEGVTTTFTQPAVTRDAAGLVTTRPELDVEVA